MKAYPTNSSRLNLLPMNLFSHEIDRWFDRRNKQSQCVNSVPASIWEDENRYFFEFDLPGFAADNIDVNVVKNVLNISAERHDANCVSSCNDSRCEDASSESHCGESSCESSDRVAYLRQERSFGSFERSFTLPERVDESQIEAHLDNGVLRIEVAKAQEAQAKKVEIKTRSTDV